MAYNAGERGRSEEFLEYDKAKIKGVIQTLWRDWGASNVVLIHNLTVHAAPSIVSVLSIARVLPVPP